MSFPLMYRSARGASEQVDENLRPRPDLGMSEWRIFRKVLSSTAIAGDVMAACAGSAGWASSAPPL